MELLTNPLVWILVLVLAGIGLAGSLPTYYLGQKGMPFIRERFPSIKEERWQQIEAWFQRWGAPIVLLTVLIRLWHGDPAGSRRPWHQAWIFHSPGGHR